MPHQHHPAPTDLVGKRLGNCLIEKYLSRGGMGEIYVATQIHLGRKVAIKTPRRQTGRFLQNRRCLDQEAKFLATIRHVNVVTVHDMGRTRPQQLYLVLELLSGSSLDYILARRPRIPVEYVIRLAKEVARGLAACHKAGIVCIDVKPENIMVVDGPLVGGQAVGATWVKLIDLGAAQAMGAGGQVKAPCKIVGTPEYTAPEIIRGEAFDQRADVYAFGTLLYELLAGEPPFHDVSVRKVLHKQVCAQPPALLAEHPALHRSAPLAVLVEDCLRKFPENRPPSMLDILRRLDGLASEYPAQHHCSTPNLPTDPVDPTASVETKRLSQIVTVPLVENSSATCAPQGLLFEEDEREPHSSPKSRLRSDRRPTKAHSPS